MGVFSNHLTNSNPNVAHAVLIRNTDNSYMVSVRAPLISRTGASDLCCQFPTGGGRKAAAGINKLHDSQLDEFINKFEEAFSS